MVLTTTTSTGTKKTTVIKGTAQEVADGLDAIRFSRIKVWPHIAADGSFYAVYLGA